MNASDFTAVLANVTGVAVIPSADLFDHHGDGLPLVTIENELGRATLALQGAHLLSFIPAGGKELLWVSPLAKFADDKAVRGGIPLCMPWFGGHPAGLPSHGFARTMDWTLASAEQLANGATRVVLTLAHTAETLQQWPHEFKFELQVDVGTELTLTLRVDNLSNTPAPFTYAFHTYFNVADYTQSPIHGLENLTYIDTLGEVRRLKQEGVLQLSGSTDRVYLDVPAVQTIVDGDRSIQITSSAHSAVVWNPGEYAVQMADVGANMQGFVCVERGDVFDNALEIAAGARFTSTMTLAEVR
ncbi:D-hexose-6-phosphate mutarotase [Chitinibacter tainanensis]|uniref:D-hexose-6-phosphate mutarotase n=1 Tax=Chitinibacter tainanensis TaxID=230667 RepID=UPI00041B950D|nr:D-hexose-6-phosphate mutarotase [Chitinibacter tainanensis]